MLIGDRPQKLYQSTAGSQTVPSTPTIQEGIESAPPAGRSRENSQALAPTSSKLSKTVSTSSGRSVKSVRSVHAVGSYPLGSLRIHSPSSPRNCSDQHEVLKSGDAVIILDVAAGVTLGYDSKAFTFRDGHAFEGVKNIPPGPHFFWAGLGEEGVRVGFWIMSSKRASDEYGEVHILRWNKFNETLEEEVSEAETRIQKQDVSRIAHKLEIYDDKSRELPSVPGSPGIQPSDTSNLWTRMTNSMKGAMLDRITGGKWNQWRIASTHDSVRPSAAEMAKIGEMPFIVGAEDYVLNFIFPRADTKTYRTDVVGRERTEQAMDTSVHVMAVSTRISYANCPLVLCNY